jgi:cell division protein FtsL
MRTPLAELGIAVALAFAVVGSGLWLIRTQHEARQLFVELEALNREQDRSTVDWGRLQLEQSTWATHARIESLARERLNLAAPTEQQIVVVTELGDTELGDTELGDTELGDGR